MTTEAHLNMAPVGRVAPPWCRHGPNQPARTCAPDGAAHRPVRRASRAGTVIAPHWPSSPSKYRQCKRAHVAAWATGRRTLAARAPNTWRRARPREGRKPGTGPRGEACRPARTLPFERREASARRAVRRGTARRAVRRAWCRGPYSTVWARPKPNMNVNVTLFLHLSTISTYFSSNS